jgi:DNA-binding SARP family transcriptional activator/tetratricopeptide (TPR) repeat protein
MKSYDEMELHISTLGAPEVYWQTTPVLIPRRQTRALLYYLSARLQPIPRQQLCFVFWPDVAESTARRNFTRLLNHLRRVLPDPNILIATDDQVLLDPQRTWSDTMTLNRLWTRYTQAMPPRDNAVLDLRQAVALYRGPFLHGFNLPGHAEFELWVATESEHWQRMYLKILATLTEESANTGDYPSAIVLAQRYLAIDDLSEEMHRRLIALYGAVNDRHAAQEQFESCVTILERELGVDPLPETQMTYHAVLEGHGWVPAPPALHSVWETLPGLNAPLVGRDEALTCLENAYRAMRAGQSRFVLITGEPGIGKSRLMRDFATRLEGQALILAGAGHRDTSVMPYQPIVQALRLAFKLRPPEMLSHARWLVEATRLMPELRDVYPTLPEPTPLQSAEVRVRLFESLRELTLSLAGGRRPLLLCLDDLQWADSVTLEWLAYLGRELHAVPLLIIGTCRSSESEATAGLRYELHRCGILSELPLAGLEAPAILQLLHQPMCAHLEPSQADVLAYRLRRATGGNPFFILETLRGWIESGCAEERLADLNTAERKWPLPDTVRDAVNGRLERLGAQARQVLEAGAVLGETFDFDVVYLTSGRQAMETVDGLDELVARQLLFEQPLDNRTDQFRFQHAIVREVVYRGLSTWRRRLLHRRAAEVLQKLHPNDAVILAGHYENAGEPGRAARYALQAGLAAKAIFAHVEGRAHFDHALALLQQETISPQGSKALVENHRLRIEALNGRGWAHRLLGDMEAFDRDSQEIARLAASLNDPYTVARLRWREAYAHRWFCRFDRARQTAEAGLRLSQETGDALLEGMCWREIGRIAREVGHYEQARHALEQARRIFAAEDEIVYELHALSNLSTLALCQGDDAQATAWGQQALTQCDTLHLPLERRLPLGDLGAAAASRGDGDTARQYLQESLGIARQIADRTQEIFCLGHLGWLAVQERQATDALMHLHAALRLAEQIHSCTEQSWLHAGLAEAQSILGDEATAAFHAQRALHLAQTLGQAYELALAKKIIKRET